MSIRYDTGGVIQQIGRGCSKHTPITQLILYIAVYNTKERKAMINVKKEQLDAFLKMGEVFGPPSHMREERPWKLVSNALDKSSLKPI